MDFAPPKKLKTWLRAWMQGRNFKEHCSVNIDLVCLLMVVRS